MSNEDRKQITFYIETYYKDAMTPTAKGNFGSVTAYLKHLILADLRQRGVLDARNRLKEAGTVASDANNVSGDVPNGVPAKTRHRSERRIPDR